MNKNNSDLISMQTLKRLPVYLEYLERMSIRGVEYISTPSIARELGLSEILVKKDLSFVLSEFGKPRVGHKIESIIDDIIRFLGRDNFSRAVLIGAGKLGCALLGYDGFQKWNIEISMAFDVNASLFDKTVNSIKIMDVSQLEEYCLDRDINLGIITVDEKHAQEICDKLVRSGVKAIWNFAPIILKAPEDIIIQNENLAISLAVLSQRLSKMVN